MPLDIAQLRHQLLGEIAAPGEAEKAGEFFQRPGIRRQSVSLLIGHHLQAVLDAAQEFIGGRQLIARGGVDPAAGRERCKRCDRRAAAQLVMAAAGNELLGLDKEFDLTNTAAAELDIVALHRDLAVAAISVNLPLHLVNVGDGGVIEIFAPDERHEIAQELLAGGEIAGARARLDQSRALPVLPAALVIIERRFGRDRDLGRGRIGAKAQVDPEHVAVRIALLHELHQVAGQTHIERHRLDIWRQRRRSRIEEHDEVDVA